MTTGSIVVAGLPGSGKTTFLAALWHLIFGRELPTELSFKDIARGDYTHLNAITDRWLRAEEQERTLPGETQVVSLNLLNGQNESVQITFPDVAGETFSRMWEHRECPVEVGEMLQSGNVLLFINANKIVTPLRVLDLNQQANALEEDAAGTAGEEELVAWSPQLTPTQVQLVSLLSSMSEDPLDIGPRKLCVVLSAWDKAKEERLSPLDFLARQLPLLAQYIATNAKIWECRIYGVSAQGGDYDGAGKRREQAQQMRAMNEPSRRILITRDGVKEQYDLTAALLWLAT